MGDNDEVDRSRADVQKYRVEIDVAVNKGTRATRVDARVGKAHGKPQTACRARATFSPAARR